MSILSKAELLTPSDLRCETIQIGPLGGEVVMQELSVWEQIQIRREFNALDAENEEDATRGLVALVVASLRNEDRSVMFPPEERAEAVEALMARSSASVRELVRHCQRIQGMMTVEAVKEAVGNSEATRGEDSSFGSPETQDTPPSAP